MRYLLVSIDKTKKKEISVPDEIVVKNDHKSVKRKATTSSNPAKKIRIVVKNGPKSATRKATVLLNPAKKNQIAKPIAK